ncbi:BadF/BadG/BcrA/BcrD ATPase family protein [Nonomuraea sp. NPDC000554]|uniref:N-acetylglucosamine kinase n=1 Tax=Nonomuraea sp. NPDC000554 TaxID=3154259 RepID=UPI003329AA64
MESTLSIDAGQSGCRLRLGDREADAAGLPLGVPPGEALLRTLTPLVDSMAGDMRIGTVAAGVTGVHGRPSCADEILRAWSPRYGTRRVVVADDCVTGYLGALGEQAGAVVAAGTGGVVLASDVAAASARVDGLGHLLGDAGSGFWIGRRGLEEAFRCADGRGGSRALLDLAGRHYGDLGELPTRLSADPARGATIAGFAVDVAEAARAGDAIAAAIWTEAGRLLAESTLAALRRTGIEKAPVSWTGALFSAGGLMLDPFTAALPGLDVRPPRGAPLDGASALAVMGAVACFGPLVDTATRKEDK